MVELLQALGWNWVAALGSDDEYGRQGLSLFSSLANARGICIAHEGLVPLPHRGSLRLGTEQSLLHQVNQSSVQVVVLFSSTQAARTLFSYSIRYKLSPKVWVASEAWLTSDLVMTLPGMAEVGTVLGFLQQGAPIPEFPSYVQTRLALAADPAFCAALDAEQPGLEEHVVGSRCPQCDHITLENISAGLLHHQTFAAYAAVYGVAQALHNTLLCNASGCPTREPVQPWQVRVRNSPRTLLSLGDLGGNLGWRHSWPSPPHLLQHTHQLLENMYNMSFRARGLALRFDASGNVNMDYALKLWVWQDPTPELRTVGTFNGRLELWRSQMRWHTPGKQVSAGRPVPGCTAAFPSARSQLRPCLGVGGTQGTGRRPGRYTQPSTA